MARELKKRVAEIEQLESKSEMLREARGEDLTLALALALALTLNLTLTPTLTPTLTLTLTRT